MHLFCSSARTQSCLTMAAPWEVFPAWERPAAAAADDLADEVDLSGLTQDECADVFGDYIVQLKSDNVLSAKQASILAYWAHRAGVGGIVAKLAFEPSEGKPTGHYSRHWDSATASRAEDEHYLTIDVPLSRRADCSRTLAKIPVSPPFLGIAEEVSTTPDMGEQLKRAISKGILPASYVRHPVVTSNEHQEPVYPLALYCDGVAFSRTDSVLGFFTYCIITGVRHLVCTLRKSELCKCGCRGWCSIHPVLMMLRWAIIGMIDGSHPTARPDGAPWAPQDVVEASRAGRRFGWKAVVLHIKADWQEHVTTLGFASWTTLEHPYPACQCTRANWDAFQGLNAFGCPWRSKSLEDYEAACGLCEQHRTITEDVFPALRGNMFFDKRVQGDRGRCLGTDFAPLRLLKGDRLEPSYRLSTTHDFDSKPRPFDVTFWRTSVEGPVRHRNPLFSKETHLGPENMVIDWLHCLSLGVFQYFINWVLHSIVEENSLRVPGTTMAERMQGSVVVVRSMVFEWYSSETRAGRNPTRIQDLTVGMLGTKDECISLHGSETNDFLIFCVDVLLQRCTTVPGHGDLVSCGTSFCRMLRLIRGSHDAWGPSQAQEPKQKTGRCGNLRGQFFTIIFYNVFNVFKSIQASMNSNP